MGQKVNMMSSFPNFSQKVTALMPMFKKKLPISKKHDALIPIFYQPNIHDLKTTVLLYYFISNFYEKPPTVIPIFGQKTSFLS